MSLPLRLLFYQLCDPVQVNATFFYVNAAVFMLANIFYAVKAIELLPDRARSIYR
jgi:hypothetical protein